MPLYQVIELDIEYIEILDLFPGLATEMQQDENLTSSQFS